MYRQVFFSFAIAACCALASATAGAGVLPKPATTEAVVKAAGVSSYVLPNGFKIILLPVPSVPGARIELVVKTGSLLEGYGESGMAHLLEHMLFKSAGSRANIKADLTKIGARWNANTTADRTSYFETVPADAEAIDEAIRIEADRFIRASFTQQDLASEMTVVRNELERNDSDPDSVLIRLVQRQSFAWLGYGRSTIGVRSDIEDAPFDSLKGFHKKHYRPDNAFIIISGNFDSARVLALVTELFAEARNPSESRITSWTREPPQAVTNRSEVYLPAGITMAMSAWKIPQSTDRQSIALSLASSAICSRDWGSLRKTLVVDRKSAVSVSCFGMDWPQAGLLVASAKGGKDADAEVLSRSLRDHIEEAATKGISQDQLDRAKSEEVNSFARSVNSHQVFSRMLSAAEVAGDWRLAFLEQDILKEIRLDEANLALRTWLVSTNRSDVLLRHAEKAAAPELPKTPDLSSMLVGKDWTNLATKSDPTPRDARELARATIKVSLDDGRLEAALIPRKTQGDRAWLVFSNDYGNEEALRGRFLACRIASSLVAFGGAGMNRDELNRRLERLQASWELNLGRISIEGPRDNMVDALEILLAAWRQPELPVAEFDQLKARAISGTEAALKDPSALAANQGTLRFDNYPDLHPRKNYSLAEEIEQLKTLRYEDVRSCQQDFSGLAHARLVLVGDFSEDEFKSIGKRIGAVPPAKVPYRRVPELDSPATVDASPITVARPGHPNANVEGVSYIRISDSHEDFPALRIAVNILGGNTDSRIWNRLRENDGLAYGANATLAGSVFERRTVLSLAASASSDKAEVALAALKEEFEKALKYGFSEKEVERAKVVWVKDRRRYAEDERLYASRLVQAMTNGRDFSWFHDYDQRVEAMSAKSVTEAFRKYFGAAPVVWIIGKGS